MNNTITTQMVNAIMSKDIEAFNKSYVEFEHMLMQEENCRECLNQCFISLRKRLKASGIKINLVTNKDILYVKEYLLDNWLISEEYAPAFFKLIEMEFKYIHNIPFHRFGFDREEDLKHKLVRYSFFIRRSESGLNNLNIDTSFISYIDNIDSIFGYSSSAQTMGALLELDDSEIELITEYVEQNFKPIINIIAVIMYINYGIYI